MPRLRLGENSSARLFWAFAIFAFFIVFLFYSWSLDSCAVDTLPTEFEVQLSKVPWHCQSLNSSRTAMPLLDPSGSIAAALRARGELLAAAARGRLKPSPSVRSDAQALTSKLL